MAGEELGEVGDGGCGLRGGTAAAAAAGIRRGDAGLVVVLGWVVAAWSRGTGGMGGSGVGGVGAAVVLVRRRKSRCQRSIWLERHRCSWPVRFGGAMLESAASILIAVNSWWEG